MIQIDVWQLLAVLLTTAVFQEFIIKPCVEFLKHWYRKAKTKAKEQYNKMKS